MAISKAHGKARTVMPMSHILHKEVQLVPRPISKNNAFWHQVVRHPLARKVKSIDTNDGTLMGFNGYAMALFNSARQEYALNHPALEATILQWSIEQTAFGKYFAAATDEGLLTEKGIYYMGLSQKHGQRAERLLVTITDISARISKDRAAAANLAARTITVDGSSSPPVKSEWDDEDEETDDTSDAE